MKFVSPHENLLRKDTFLASMNYFSVLKKNTDENPKEKGEAKLRFGVHESPVAQITPNNVRQQRCLEINSTNKKDCINCKSWHKLYTIDKRESYSSEDIL